MTDVLRIAHPQNCPPYGNSRVGICEGNPIRCQHDRYNTISLPLINHRYRKTVNHRPIRQSTAYPYTIPIPANASVKCKNTLNTLAICICICIRCSQMNLDVPRCFQMFLDVPRCSQMFLDVPRCSQMILDVPRCSQMFLDVPRCSQMFLYYHR